MGLIRAFLGGRLVILQYLINTSQQIASFPTGGQREYFTHLVPSSSPRKIRVEEKSGVAQATGEWRSGVAQATGERGEIRSSSGHRRVEIRSRAGLRRGEIRRSAGHRGTGAVLTAVNLLVV